MSIDTRINLCALKLIIQIINVFNDDLRRMCFCLEKILLFLFPDNVELIDLQSEVNPIDPEPDTSVNSK